MNYEKLVSKTDYILAWLEENDIGALEPVLKQMIETATSEGLTPEQYKRYWEAIRALCKTLPNSPIRKGTQTTLPAQAQAVVDSVVNRVVNAFVDIGEPELMVDVIMPARTIGRKFNDIQELAEYFGGRVERILTDSHKLGFWDGKLTDDNITGFTLPVKVVKEATE